MGDLVRFRLAAVGLFFEGYQRFRIDTPKPKQIMELCGKPTILAHPPHLSW
jgi:hypothetical protein